MFDVPCGGTNTQAVRSLKDCLKRDGVKKITQEIMDKLTFNNNHPQAEDVGTAAGAFPTLLGSSITLLTVVRACLVLATTRQISQQVSETDHSHQYNHVTCAHHRGAHGATCQTLSCGEDTIIVKCDLIYLTVKGVLEKEDSYDDMHGLSHPSHANDAADQSNNVGNFHPEILKHE